MRTQSIISAFLLVLFACGVALAAQTVNSADGYGSNDGSSGNQIGMANPASVYCEKVGGKIDIITKDDGSQYGMCVFANGTECEEWAYYRSECGNTVPFETSPNMSISPVEPNATVVYAKPDIEPVLYPEPTPTILIDKSTPVSNEMQTTVLIVKCAVDDSFNKEINSLLVMLKDAESKNDTESMKQIKLKITSLSEESNRKLKACETQQNAQTTSGVAGGEVQTATRLISASTTTASASSSICEVPAELQAEYDKAWSIYKNAIANGDEQAAINSKPAIAKAEQQINEIKAKCQPTTAVSITTEKPSETPSVTSSGQGVGTTAVTATGECAVPVELTQEFEGQWKKYNTAIANNDTETAIAVKARIAEIEKKLASTKGQCVKTIVSSDAKTSDVVSYYKEKMTETLSTTGDVDAQIIALKQLKADIDNTIADLIKKKSEFNASDATGLVDEIKIKKNEIMAGSVSIANPTASINTEVNSKGVKIKSTSTGASINEGSITVAVSEAAVSGNRLMVGSNEVKVAPSEISGKTKMTVNQVSMDTENGKAVYNANGTEKRNLFAVIPVTIEKTAKVDASNGNVISEDKPWWSFLTTESQ